MIIENGRKTYLGSGHFYKFCVRGRTIFDRFMKLTAIIWWGYKIILRISYQILLLFVCKERKNDGKMSLCCHLFTSTSLLWYGYDDLGQLVCVQMYV